MKHDQILDHAAAPRADEQFSFSFAQGMTTFQRVEVFHRNMNLPYAFAPVTPTVSDRLLRGKLMLEEFVEFIEKGLGLTLEAEFNGTKLVVSGSQLSVTHMEGDKYCPVETLDGICDMKVIADGTGVAFGLPVDQGDWEVFCSNMSKLDDDGNPIINDGVLRPDLPVGKLLKSDNYIPANLVRVIIEAQPDDKEPATLAWLLEHGEME
jgi:predicted HAD superfamily Cof-like phosphohydrolase